MSNNNNNRVPSVQPPSNNANTRSVNAETDARKPAAKVQKEERMAEMNQRIEVTNWKSPDNVIVEDDILKQIVGYDPSLFSVDMLQKNCGKLGLVSCKFTKGVCIETIVKAVKDRTVYYAIDLQLSKSADSIGI
jgi:hypothetical protein